MAKTRSQTGNTTIKKEEEEDRKPIIGLRSITMTTRGKIPKRKPFKGDNTRLPAQQVKVEEDTDTKSLLKSSSKCTAVPEISQEQINQLIDYVVNHKKSVLEALRKVNMSINSGYKYFNLYKNDPEGKIPSPGSLHMQNERVITQRDVENLIKYIVDDKISIQKASAKANMTYSRGHYYYSRYVKDPDHKIPIPSYRQNHTQGRKNKLISFIVNDKMSTRTASKRAKMSTSAGRYHYHKYFEVQNPDIPTPSHIAPYKRYTPDRIDELISYIVDDHLDFYQLYI